MRSIKAPPPRYLTFLLFCLVIYFPIFQHLDRQPFNSWDESLFAMRAMHMAETGEYLSNWNQWTDSAPDQWSTKPPFTTWIQVVFLKIFGFNEVALRLPSALAALGVVFLFLFITKKEFGDMRVGYCAGFVLVTSLGFVALHGSRTGDQDAPVAFYLMAGAYAFFKYLKSEAAKRRRQWLALLAITLIASTLTKYVYGLFFLPGFVAYAVYKKKLPALLKRGEIWAAALLLLAIAGGWLALMEWKTPGFFERAFFHEVFDRYTTAYRFHDLPFFYYFETIGSKDFLPWVFFLPVTAVLFFYEKKPWHDFALLLFLCALGLLLVNSFSKTKAIHYAVSAYPPMAMLAGIGLWELLKSAGQLLRRGTYLPLKILAGIYFLLWPFVIEPYAKIFDQTYAPGLSVAGTSYGYLFRKIEKRHPALKNFTLLHPGAESQAILYAGLYNRRKGYAVRLSSQPEEVRSGDTIMVCDKKMIQELAGKWEMQTIQAYEHCFLAKISGEKIAEAPPD